MASKGRFIDFLLTYEGKTSDEQAREILKQAQELIDGGAVGVGITYSANYQQTETIRKTYASGEWNTLTSGGNQAMVMAAMESLEGGPFAKLQGKLRIVPLTTMTYTDFGGKTLDQVVAEDLEHVQDLLDQGWYVLGWINQPGSSEYAVGGGYAQQVYANDPSKALSPAQSKHIQDTLAGLARTYS